MLKILTRLRNYLISGLLFWIPLILTVIVIKFFLEFINSLVPKEYLPEAIFNLDTTIPGSGIILLFLIILITGVLVTNILGRRLLALWEKLLNRIPGFRNIYNILKKVCIYINKQFFTCTFFVFVSYICISYNLAR